MADLVARGSFLPIFTRGTRSAYLASAGPVGAVPPSTATPDPMNRRRLSCLALAALGCTWAFSVTRGIDNAVVRLKGLEDGVTAIREAIEKGVASAGEVAGTSR
jgi:hypothetical protein